MKLRLFRWLFVPLFVIGLVTPSAMRAQSAAPAAQAAPAPAAPALTESIPFDAAVTTGTLPNGLKYYIRRNTRPEKRVSLQLAVKAGSVDEENDQQGLAHFLEHMAFNGTKRFKPGELIAALESTGARLGPHVNAYTSFDETVYMFELPTDKPGLVEKGLQALSDFAGGMSLDPVEIDKERGVVIEEWRGGLGAGSRLRDQQIPVLYYESKYAERLPIGKPDILKGFKPERLRAFYTKWYRPDRMAIVAVGDITVAEMEAMVRKEFGAPDEAGGGRAGPHLRGAAADRPAGQDGDRFRSDAVIGLLDQQAAADAGRNRRRVPPQPGAPAGVPDAQRAIRRAVAQARCAVPRRRRLRERLEPDDVDRGAGGERAGRKDSGGPVVRGD